MSATYDLIKNSACLKNAYKYDIIIKITFWGRIYVL